MTEGCGTCMNCIAIQDARELMPCALNESVNCELHMCSHPSDDVGGCQCVCHDGGTR